MIMADTSASEEWWKNISFEAVFSGAFAGFFVTLVFGFILVLLMAFEDILAGRAISFEIEARIPIIATSTPFIAVFFLWIGIFNVVGGYLAARIACKHEIVNATLASFPFVLLLLTVPQLTNINNAYSFSLTAISLFSNILLSLTGGYIRLRQIEKPSIERQVDSDEPTRLSAEKRGLFHGRISRKNYALSFAATS